MVNVYGEDPTDAIESARRWLPIDREIILEGRYDGFPELPPGPWTGGNVWPSEHAKRNAMLMLAGEADRDRWIFWLDCDERVFRTSPQIALQLKRLREHVAGIRFVEPLPPDPSLTPGLEDPRRGVRDIVRENFSLRLYRHLPGLEYIDRHDSLWWRHGHLSGHTPAAHAANDGFHVHPSVQVDVEVMHLWWMQPAERRAAKQLYYHGPQRSAETRS